MRIAHQERRHDDMAIYHLHVSMVSRSKGHNVIAKASYINASKMENRETGEVSDFSRKSDVIHTEISLPSHAPQEFKDSQTLWNSVIEVEKAKNAQLARRGDFALPKELSKEENLKLAREYIENTFVKNGMCVEWAFHDKPDNPHIDFIATTRPIKENGEWGAKSKKVYDLDENGNKIFQKKDKQGRKIYKNHKEDTVDWNKKETLEHWRSEWANYCNRALEKHGHEQRIDHRSYERQGIDKIPTIHEGVHAQGMQKRLREKGQNFTSRRAEMNIEIRKENLAIEKDRRDYEVLKYVHHANTVNNKLIDIHDNIRNDTSISNIQNQIKQLELIKNETLSMQKSFIYEPKTHEKMNDIVILLEKKKSSYERKLELLERDNQPRIDDVARKLYELQQKWRSDNAQLSVLKDNLQLPKRQLIDRAKEIEKVNNLYHENKNKLHMLEKQRANVKGWFKGKEKDKLDFEINQVKGYIKANESQFKELGVEDTSKALETAQNYRKTYDNDKWVYDMNKPQKELLEAEIKELEGKMSKLIDSVPKEQRDELESKVQVLDQEEKQKHIPIAATPEEPQKAKELEPTQIKNKEKSKLMSMEQFKDEIAERRENRQYTRLSKENYMTKHKTNEKLRELNRKSKGFDRDR